MSDIRWLAKGAADAERMRWMAKRRGYTGKGRLIWTQREIDTLRRMVPGYAPIVKALRRRTYNAVRNKSRSLGLAPKRHIWTGAEIARLRRLYPKADDIELQRAFPNYTLASIKGAARYHGIYRARKPFKITGIHVIDAIRARAFELNYSMRDLDAMVGGGCTYFTKAGWHHGLNRRAIHKVVQELGGQITVEWIE